MHRLSRIVCAGLLFAVPFLSAAAASASRWVAPVSKSNANPQYFWSRHAVGSTAELLTLNCYSCGIVPQTDASIALLSVLRDNLGDGSVENDRLSYVWLLSAGRLTLGQHLLSAVPFFYWTVGHAGPYTGPGMPKPLMDVSAPLSPVVVKAGRNILQWTALDPLTTTVRASSRSYNANQSDNERMYLEQAIVDLRNAPASPDGLSIGEINTLFARLELRKSMLGGLLDSRRTADFGQHVGFEEERIRSRNYEVLRQLAEKTGTVFEPLNLAASGDNYAILWFPVHASHPDSGTPGKPIWKILNIRDPWSDPDLSDWHGPVFDRSFDSDGRLSPTGSDGVRSARMIPLAVYSLTYPQMPLLLVDFRDRLHIRRHEMAQRSITELTSGVLGLSRFANWYYYAGALVYQTIWARRGTAANQSNRLDSYSQFRFQLALDNQLDGRLHDEMSARSQSLVVNPFSYDPARGVTNAEAQYARLTRAASDGSLEKRLEDGRRAELAAFSQSTKASVSSSIFHALSFGTYTHRVPKSEQNLANLDRERRLQFQVAMLDAALQDGTDPRVSLDPNQVSASAAELRSLAIEVGSGPAVIRAQATLKRLAILIKGIEEKANYPQVTDSIANLQ